MERRFVVTAKTSRWGGRRYRVERVPDGLVLSARSWHDVQVACPECGVPCRNTDINPAIRERLLRDWGPQPEG